MVNNKSGLYTYRFLTLSILFGVIATLFHYEGFGVGDSIEQLPIVLRAIDSTYLPNDFFVNEASSSVARAGFAQLLAKLAGGKSDLPLIYLLITYLSNIVISAITFFFTRRLFSKSNLAGIVASALVMSVGTFDLGYSSYILSSSLTPHTVILPLLFLAIFAVAYGHLVVGALLCGVASLIHPLYGLELSGLLIISFYASKILNERKVLVSDWKSVIFSTMVLAGFSMLSLIPQISQERIDPIHFIYIVGYFRHPHHYIPSTFGLVQYVLSVSFVSAGGLAWYYWKRTHKETSQTHFVIPLLVSFIFLICICGYVFVEIIPSRLCTTAQTFRLLFFVKWLGLIFIGGTIGDFIHNGKESRGALFIVSTLHPLSVGVAFLSQASKKWVETKLPEFGVFFQPPLVLLTIIAILIHFNPSRILTIWLFFVLICIFASFNRKHLYLFCLVLIIVTSITWLGIVHHRIPLFGAWLEARIVNRINKVTTLGIVQYEFGDQGKEAAKFARQNTPEDSVFLTPPDFGQFRIVAERAIVVDFKAFPFSDAGIEGWYSRIISCYGEPILKGFASGDQLNANYSQIDDGKIAILREKYDVSYAILFSKTTTDYPIVFVNDKYKIVDLQHVASF